MDMDAMMRRMQIQRGALIRSRFAWESYLRAYPVTEDAAAKIVAVALAVNTTKNPTIAFPPELIGTVYDRLAAL